MAQPCRPWRSFQIRQGSQGSKLCSILEVSERYLRHCSLADVDEAVMGGSALQALEKLLGSSKGCQDSKLCNIIQVSERCLRLYSLGAIDKERTGGSACQVLEKLPDRARAARVPSFIAFCKYLKDVSDCTVLQLLTRKGQVV